MATRFILQKDKRSHNTYAPNPSDTTASVLLSPSANTPVVVPAGAHLVLVAVTGNEVYFSVNQVPVIPTTGSFVFQAGEQINNGAKQAIPVNPTDTINFISDAVAKVQLSFYENERVE